MGKFDPGPRSSVVGKANTSSPERAFSAQVRCKSSTATHLPLSSQWGADRVCPELLELQTLPHEPQQQQARQITSGI